MKLFKRILFIILSITLLLGTSAFVLISVYQKEITIRLTEYLQTTYGLHLEAKDMKVSFFDNWPHASIELLDVKVQNESGALKQLPLLKAGSVALSFNLRLLLRGEFVLRNISVKNAEVNLIRDVNGETNFEFKKQIEDSLKQADDSTGIKIEMRQVVLRNVQFRFINRQRGQLISIRFGNNLLRVKNYQDGLRANLGGYVYVGQLLFNPAKGAFLTNREVLLNLDIVHFKGSKNISVFPGSTVEIDQQKYNVTSSIDFGINKRLALFIENNRCDVAAVAELLTPKIKKVLGNFSVKNTVSAKFLIVSNIGKREEPLILLKVLADNIALTIGKSEIPYSAVSFQGRIRSIDSSGTRGDIKNADILFQNVKGRVYEFPFEASIGLKDLTDPQISLLADLNIDPARIHFKVAKDFVLRGKVTAHISYSGPAKQLNNEQFLNEPMKLKAEIILNNFSYKEVDRPYMYSLNGRATINNKQLVFEDLLLNTVAGKMNLKGRADNFLPYLLGRSNNLKVDLLARSARLDLNAFFAGLGEPKDKVKGSVTEKNQKSVAKNRSGSVFEFNVKLIADHLKIRKVETEHVMADIGYKGRELHIRSLKLNTCDGKVSATVLMKDFSSIRASISAEQLNVNKVFTQNDNFGQEAVKSENLKGSLYLDAKFATELDEEMKVKGETMKGEVKLILRDGHLLKFEPVMNLSQFLFSNREFEDISFSELSDRFTLDGYKMRIEELEIASNILNLYVVDGLYNFKGVSTLNVLVPWNNLKRRGRNYVPVNTGESAQNTRGVKLNFHGPNKNMKISMGHRQLES